MARSSDYITAVRGANKAIWDGINELVALQREYVALDYGTTLVADTQGNNVGYTPAEITSVVFDTANALVAVLDAGHKTNMAKLL